MKSDKSSSFKVSHPAQTDFKILGGLPPSGSDKIAKEALDRAREKRLAKESKRNTNRRGNTSTGK